MSIKSWGGTHIRWLRWRETTQICVIGMICSGKNISPQSGLKIVWDRCYENTVNMLKLEQYKTENNLIKLSNLLKIFSDEVDQYEVRMIVCCHIVFLTIGWRTLKLHQPSDG